MTKTNVYNFFLVLMLLKGDRQKLKTKLEKQLYSFQNFLNPINLSSGYDFYDNNL